MGLAWDEGLTSSQEYTLMFEILKQGGSFVFDDQINTIVRDRESGSISQQNSAKKWKRYVNLRAEILTYCRECDFPDADELDQAMFTSIRLLYPHDPESALQFYRDLIPANFVPSVSTVTTRGYIRVFKYLGFENTERFRRIVKV
jgi:hypothetical protein